MLKYLIEKEFKQFFRNKFLPRQALFMPVMMLLIMPWAASMEVKNIHLAVVDNDRSSYSGRLVREVSASVYFHLVAMSDSYEQAMEHIESGDADIILEIPPRFEESLRKEGTAQVLVAANAVNSTKGGLGSSYLVSIVSMFGADLRAENGEVLSTGSGAVIDVVPLNRFNPLMNYQIFMVPAMMVMLLTMICGFMPALNIVSEREIGTIEQINVTPVGKFTFIVAKLIPYWVIGFFILSVSFILVWLVYHMIPAGSLLTIFVGVSLYVLTVSGLGLIVSNHSDTMQQAMFVMFFFMMVLMLMSGLFTPITSMPHWAQYIAAINPMKYFIDLMRAVYLKGSGIGDLLPELGALALFSVMFNLLAVVSYRKTR